MHQAEHDAQADSFLTSSTLTTYFTLYTYKNLSTPAEASLFFGQTFRFQTDDVFLLFRRTLEKRPYFMPFAHKYG